MKIQNKVKIVVGGDDDAMKLKCLQKYSPAAA